MVDSTNTSTNTSTNPPVNQTTKNLAAIPFGAVIGNPLKAVIEAQGIAAKATVDFIQAVGFKPKPTTNFEDPFAVATKTDGTVDDADVGEIRNVVFKYQKSNADGTTDKVELTVPILTIIPIPFIRVDKMTIDFTADLAEINIESQKTSDESNRQRSNKGQGYRWRRWWHWGGRYDYNASYSNTHKSTASSSARHKTAYTMDVNVQAVQDDVPGGLSRVLSILENAIDDKPVVEE